MDLEVLKMLEPGSDVLTIISGGAGVEPDAADRDRASTKLTSKPVVIGDAVPVPAICPEPVEQLLQAAKVLERAVAELGSETKSAVEKGFAS